MRILVNVLAVIGAFWAGCAVFGAVALTYGAWSRRRIRARHAVNQWHRTAIEKADDTAFLLAIGVDPARLAHRPYDHEREGL